MKRGRPGVLTEKRRRCLINFIEKIASIGHPLPLRELRLKVAAVTQIRPTSWSGGLPRWSWAKWFKIRQPKLALRCSRVRDESCKRLVSHQREELAWQLTIMAHHKFEMLWVRMSSRMDWRCTCSRFQGSETSSFNHNGWERALVWALLHQCGGGGYSKLLRLQGEAIGHATQDFDDKLSLFKVGDTLHFVCPSKRWKMSVENRHVLIMNGRSSYVTMEFVHQARSIGLDLITLLAHILHVF